MVRPRDAIVLLGMGRSGTSALTRVLSLCGGALPDQLLAPNFANWTGYWESERAVELNNVFLQAHASSFFDATLTLQLDPVAGLARAAFVDQIAEFVSSAFEAGGPLLLKEPRISVLLPYWIEALHLLGMRPVFVHIVRNAADVAASLIARDHLSVEHALALWLKYNLAAERDARGGSRMFVTYEDLMDDWEAVVSRCVTELGVGLSIDEDARARVAGFLSAGLHHHRGSATGAAAANPAVIAWTGVTQAVLQQSRAEFRAAMLDQVLRDFAEWGSVHAPAVDLAAMRRNWERREEAEPLPPDALR